MRARSALFTIFGDVVRPAGGEAWLTTLTACMETLGVTPEATRTALHRMTGEGWVEPRRSGRYAAYRLTSRGVDRLEEAAARIYRLRAADWDGRWRLLIGPGITRNGDLARALRWMGFGRLAADLWVSPHPHGDRLQALLAEHGAGGLVRFVTDSRHVEDRRAQDARIVGEAWDLAELHQAHVDFLERWRAHTTGTEPAEAFRTRVLLVHHWRSFLFLDPGLPVALLPGDWRGDEAAACFRRLYETVDDAAWSFYEALAALAPANGGGATAPARRPDESPFARGLQALHTVKQPA